MRQPLFKRFIPTGRYARPFGISLIALGSWLTAALLLCYALLRIVEYPALLLVSGLRVVLYVLILGFTGWGLWQLKKDYYQVAVAIHCFGIFGSLLTWGQIGAYALLLSAGSLAIVVYMLRQMVRAAFRMGQR